MRLSQAFAYINEPTKPDKDRKLLYTHINITKKLDDERVYRSKMKRELQKERQEGRK